MKQHQILMIAALITSLLAGSAFGEYQDDRLFGNGRFLRRMRNDDSDQKKAAAKKKQDGKKSAKADAKGKKTTPAQRSAGRTPTPAVRPSQAPTAATGTRQSRAQRPTQVARYPSKSASVANKVREQPAAQNSNQSDKTLTIGFGMLVESRDEKLVVTQINPRGNAAEAGIKRGDIIVDAGGMGLGSIEDFNEIANVLGQGDQVELEITRRGKKQEVLIQFGDEPKEDELAKAIPPITQPLKKNDYSFVPEQDDASPSGMRSVMVSPQQDQVANPKPVRSAQRQRKNQSQATTSQQTIEQQRRQIEQMQREIEQLKRQDPIQRSTVPSRVQSRLDGPSLSGPSN